MKEQKLTETKQNYNFSKQLLETVGFIRLNRNQQINNGYLVATYTQRGLTVWAYVCR